MKLCISKLVTSKTLLLLPVYFIFIVSAIEIKRHTTEYLLYLPHFLVEHEFLVLACILLVLPRLFACLTCTWGVTGLSHRQCEHKDCNLPFGVWTYVGNPFPECGFLFLGSSYPQTPYREIDCKLVFLQDVTIGGLGMALLHNNSQRNSPITLETTNMKVLVGESPKKVGEKMTYLLPRIKYPTTGWQSRVRISPSGDPRVWWKSHPFKMIYFWAHDSNTSTPYEEYMIVPYWASVVSFSILLILMVWSFGLFLILVVLEVGLKRVQHHLLKYNFPPPPKDFKSLVVSLHNDES